MTRTMVINDLHIPFHDTRYLTISATGMIPDIIEDSQVDRLVINGDLGDLYNWNSYGVHPEVQITKETELFLMRAFLTNLRKRFPDLHIVFLFGNHEVRYERWVIEEARPAWNFMRLERELNLEELDIEFYPYQYSYQLEQSNCFIVHSPPSYGVNGARTSLLKKIDQTYLYGCTHREQVAHVTGSSGEIYSAYFNGWLGSTNETPQHERVFSYRKGHIGWQPCFIMATVHDETEAIINQYSIRNYKTCVDGKLYDYSEQEFTDDLSYSEED